MESATECIADAPMLATLSFNWPNAAGWPMLD
jgi:hypothetical protein